MNKSLDFDVLVELCLQTHEELRGRAARAADTGLAARNWLFGWYIAEYEQEGKGRANYGKKLVDRLSQVLRSTAVRGASLTNLRKFRGFYRAYPHIQQALSPESVPPLPALGFEIQQTASVESFYHLSRQTLRLKLEGVAEDLELECGI